LWGKVLRTKGWGRGWCILVGRQRGQGRGEASKTAACTSSLPYGCAPRALAKGVGCGVGGNGGYHTRIILLVKNAEETQGHSSKSKGGGGAGGAAAFARLKRRHIFSRQPSSISSLLSLLSSSSFIRAKQSVSVVRAFLCVCVCACVRACARQLSPTKAKGVCV
jgi:hypothetical protein